MNDNTPPLLDSAPDPSTKVKDIIPSKDTWDHMPGTTYEGYNNLLTKNGIVTWADYKGTYQDWELYIVDCGVGSGKPVKPIILSDDKIIRRPALKPYIVKGNDTFTCDPDIKGCPIADTNQPIIEMPMTMFLQWVQLALAFDTEWLAYLKGSLREDSAWAITGMYFPKQHANSGHVDADDEKIEDGVIGSVHSHVSMSAFFSAEDERHFNHTVEIVVNRRAETACVVRRQLECGRFSRIKAKLMLNGCDGDAHHSSVLEIITAAASAKVPTKAMALAAASITATAPIIADLTAKLTREGYGTYVTGGSHIGRTNRNHNNGCVCVDCCNDRRLRLGSGSSGGSSGGSGSRTGTNGGSDYNMWNRGYYEGSD